MNLLMSLLSDAVKENPDAIFLTDIRTGYSFDYKCLLQSSVFIRSFLAKNNINKGDTVTLMTKNGYFFYPLLFGCASFGVKVVPVDPSLHKAEMNTILENAAPKIIFYDEDSRIKAESMATGRTSILINNEDSGYMVPSVFREVNGDLDVLDCDPDHPALIIYTSGSSGNCKGVVLTHNNLFSMAKTFASVYSYREKQRFLSVLPFYHINAPMVTGLAVIAGKSHTIVVDYFNIAKYFWQIVAKYEINVLSITPSIMKALLALFEHGPDANTVSLEYALVGTAVLPEALWRSFERHFGIICYQGYGLTETTAWAAMTPPGRKKKYSTVGIPVNCDIRVDLGKDMNNESGNIGEIMIKGDIVMKGYHKRADLNKEVLVDEWLKTGDLGYLDEDGELVIVGRNKNTIKRRGILIFSQEIDNVILEHDSIAECYTVGVENDFVETQVVSICVLKSCKSVSEEDIKHYVLSKLSPYKCPDRVVFFKKLPRNSMGKVKINTIIDILNGKIAEEILAKVNTYKFSRSKTEDFVQISNIIKQALINDGDINVVGYWGVGKRKDVGKHSLKGLARLLFIKNEINNYLPQPKLRIILILADIHGRCNGIAEDVINSYFDLLANEINIRGIESVRLSSIWHHYGLDYDEVIGQVGDSKFNAAWENFSLREQFLKQAEKRCFDVLRFEEYAKRYYAVIMAEKRCVADYFKGSIFFTYNSPDFKSVLPELPMIYLHSIKPGITAKPWFLDEKQE